LEAVFVLLEFSSPSRRIFIGSHSLPPLWFAVSVLHVRLHFPASNNMAEYKALLCSLKIAIETGIKRLDVRGDSKLVIDQVMKNASCHDDKMEAYCKAVRALEDKFYGIELNHVPRRYNKEADELAKISSG
jgi:ribonuclease HI